MSFAFDRPRHYALTGALTAALASALLSSAICAEGRAQAPAQPSPPPATQSPATPGPAQDPTAPPTTPAAQAPSTPPIEAPASPPAPAPAPAPAPLAAPNVEPPNTSGMPCEPCRRRRDDVEGFGGFMLGVATLDLSDLNDHLRASGYEEIESTMAILGGSVRAVFRSGFVAGATGAGLLTPSAGGPGAARASFGGGFGMLDFGFAFVHTRALLLTLTGGLGGYGMSIDLSEHRALAFDDVLTNPRRSASLSAGGLLGGLVLGFDGRVPIGQVDKEGMRPLFSLGVRIGALYGPPISEWTLEDGSDSTGGPSTTLTSCYAALVLAFGGAPAES